MFGDLFDETPVENEVHVSTSTSTGQRSSSSKRKSWMKDSWYYDKRQENSHVGLLNQGATCYLNSLLQCLFMTPSFRSGIYSLQPSMLGQVMNASSADSLDSNSVSNTSLNHAAPSASTGIDVDALLQLSEDYSSNSSQHTTTTFEKETIEPKKTTSESSSNTTTSSASSTKSSLSLHDEERLKLEMELIGMGFEEDVVKKVVSAHRKASLEALVEYCLNFTPSEFSYDEEEFEAPNNLTSLFDDKAEQIEYPVVRDDDMNVVSDLFFGESTPKQSFQSETMEQSNSSSSASVTSSNNASLQDGKLEEKSEPQTGVKRKKGLIELQRLFAFLESSQQRAISTESLTKSFGWKDSDVFQQHDVHELNRILFDAIEHSLRDTPMKDLISNLYRGTLVNQICCLNCNNVSEREEYFQDVTVIVKGFKSLTDSLRAFVDYELLNGENQYSCDNCKQKSDAKKRVVFRALPPILIFALSRFEYDYQHDQRKKLTQNFPFPVVLDMTEYCESSATTNNNTSTAAPEKLSKELEESLEDKEVSEDNKESNKEKKKKRVFQPAIDSSHDSNQYQLFAVIIHSGGAYGGHYHTYIRDFNAKSTNDEDTADDCIDTELRKALKAANADAGVWYDFNDSTVRQIPIETIASQYGSSKESAYMLIYWKKSHIEEQHELQNMPSHLQQEIAALNASLEQERKKYEAAVNEIEISISFPQYYTLVNGCVLKELPLDTSASTTDATTSTAATTDGTTPSTAATTPSTAATTSKSRKQSLAVDQRISIEQLKKVISEKFSDHLSGSEKYYLTELKKKNDTEHVFKTFDEDVSTLSLADLGISDDSILLVWWKGCSIDSMPFTAQPLTLHLKIKVFNNEAVPEVEISLGEFSTIFDLKQELQSMTGIPVDEQYLCNLTEKRMIVFGKDTHSKTLFDLNINSECKLTVEKYNSNSSSKEQNASIPAAKREFIAHQLITVYVSDMCSSAEPVLETVQIERDSTIHELKQLILENIAGDFTESEVHLARYVNGSVGEAYNENDLLSDVGIEEECRVALVMGAPASDMITVIFQVCSDGKFQPASHKVVVHKQSSIADCKTMMAAVIYRQPDSFRLRTTDLYDRILDDEEATLEQENITEGTNLILEEGKPPVKGQITVHFQLYNMVQLSREVPDYPLSSPALHLYAPHAAADNEHFFITPLFSLDISSQMKLSELKQLLLEKQEFKHLKSTRCMRVWCGERWLRKSSLTLKRYSISTDSFLSIQIVEENERDEDSEDDVLIYVQQRYPQFKTFGYPQEMFFAGNTVEQLLTLLSTALNIPVHQLYAAKYNKYNGHWIKLEETTTTTSTSTSTITKSTAATVDIEELKITETTPLLESELKSTESTSEQKAHSHKDKEKEQKGAKKQKNKQHAPLTGIRAKPYLLRDGDIIVVKDVSQDPENTDDFTRMIISSNKSTESGKRSNTRIKRNRPVEATLTINLDS